MDFRFYGLPSFLLRLSGAGDDELGRKLMISFLKTLDEMGDELWRLVFVNNGYAEQEKTVWMMKAWLAEEI